jgi:predicted dehydrogenase
MAKVRTGLIGCGKVGRIHAAALSRLPESEFVAVCDANLGRADAFARQYGARAFSDVRHMLAQVPLDAVVVATPHPLHAEPALAAAERGVHVLVEKPMAASLADCDAMLAATAKAGVKLGVVSQRRLYEPVVRMKAAIDAGKIGRPALGVVLMLNWRDDSYYASDPWRGRWDTEGGGVLVNQAPHQLDLLQWFLGPIEEITGYWANLNHPSVAVDDTALALIRFADGGLGCVVASLSQKPGLFTKVHVHGATGASVGVQTESGASFVAGVSEIADPPLNDLWTVPGEEHLLAAFEAEDRARFRAIDPTTHYHALQIEDFLRAILEDREPAVTGRDGRVVVEMFTAIYRSNRERRPVRFPAPGAS